MACTCGWGDGEGFPGGHLHPLKSISLTDPGTSTAKRTWDRNAYRGLQNGSRGTEVCWGAAPELSRQLKGVENIGKIVEGESKLSDWVVLSTASLAGFKDVYWDRC